MPATRDDYRRAVDAFLEDLSGLGDDVVSVLLYGSLARGDSRPGMSDVLDACVFLSAEVFGDRARFIGALEVMVRSCERLRSTGIPFHPYHYFGVHELRCTAAVFLPLWQSDDASKLLAGRDLRPHIGSTRPSFEAAATSFFEARRAGHRLSRYLLKPELTAEDAKEMVSGLKYLKVWVPVLGQMTASAFAAGGAGGDASEGFNGWADKSRALDKLAHRFPDLETGIVGRVDVFERFFEDGLDPEDLRRALGEMLTFVEDLHDRICSLRGG